MPARSPTEGELDVDGRDAMGEEERRAARRSTCREIGVEGPRQAQPGRGEEVTRQRGAGHGTAGLARRGGNEPVALEASQEPPGHDLPRAWGEGRLCEEELLELRAGEEPVEREEPDDIGLATS